MLLWAGFGFGRGLRFSDEAIPATGDGLDKPRAAGRIAQHFANFVDGRVQTVVEVNKGVGRPKAVAQFFPGDDDARAFEKYCQHSKRLILQAEATSLLAKLAGLDVGFEDSEADYGWFSCRVWRRSGHGQ